MTTDPRFGGRLPPLRRMAGAIALVVGGWLAVVIALTFGSAPGKSMAGIGPPSQTLAVIAKATAPPPAHKRHHPSPARRRSPPSPPASTPPERYWCWTPSRPAAAAACRLP